MVQLKDGEYQLGDRIDKGGFGEVFIGTKLLSQNKVTTLAIKKCKLLTGEEKRGTPDPRLEAKILQELSKINDAKHVIVEYYDSFTEGDYHYLVMEYCKHKSIYTYLLKERQRPLTEVQANDVLLNVLSALDIIHTAGYVHRDLSPKNILIHSFSEDSVPQIKIVDFGLSKKIHLIKNTVAGTPGFFDPEMMRKGYSKDVDFYALGCVAFFLLTNQLMLTKENKLSKENRLSSHEIELKMKALSLSKDAIDFVLMLTNPNKNRIESSTQIRMSSFFTKDIIQGVYNQASSIRKSIGQTDRGDTRGNTYREPLKEVQNKQTSIVRELPDRHLNRLKHHRPFRGGPSNVQSLPTNLTRRHPTKLSVATSNSLAPWPLPGDFKSIVKNVMVNKFGRAILRGPDELFICETVNYNARSKCTFVGWLINAGNFYQELRLYKPNATHYLEDFTIFPNGIPESELTLIERIKQPHELEGGDEKKAARAMYSKMRSIYNAVGEMVRKREENPNLIVDTLAKITWNGMISVELADKQVVRWQCRDREPPTKDYPNLPHDIAEMLRSVHKDFRRLFVRT